MLKMPSLAIQREKQDTIQKIRSHLFNNCQSGIDANSLANSEFGTNLKLERQRTKRYLDEMERENLLHGKKFGNTVVYYPNGKAIEEKHPHQVNVDSHINLWLDYFPGTINRPFIRVAQKRDSDMMGSIIIPLDKMNEFLEKLNDLSKKQKSIKKEVQKN